MTPLPDWLSSLPGAVRGWPLAQIHPLRVRVTLQVGLHGRIKPGSRAEVMPEEPTDNHHAATVAGIDKPVDAACRTLPAGLRCRVSLPGSRAALPPAAARRESAVARRWPSGSNFSRQVRRQSEILAGDPDRGARMPRTIMMVPTETPGFNMVHTVTPMAPD